MNINIGFTYDKYKNYDDRLQEALIVEPRTKDSNTELDRNKFLCPKDIMVSQFIIILRKRLNIKPSQSIFLFINGAHPSNNSLVGDLYLKNSDTDKFLKMHYSLEDSFGQKNFI
jgi:hypothetical protein